MAIRRETILDKMVTRFQGIASGSGSYTTNLGQNVYLWRDVPFDPVELPALNVRDLSQDNEDLTRESPNSQMWLLSLQVEVEVVTEGTGLGVDELRAAVADVILAVGTDETFDGNCLRTAYLGDEIKVDQEDRRVLGATVRFRVDYRTAKYNVT